MSLECVPCVMVGRPEDCERATFLSLSAGSPDGVSAEGAWLLFAPGSELDLFSGNGLFGCRAGSAFDRGALDVSLCWSFVESDGDESFVFAATVSGDIPTIDLVLGANA